MSVTLPYRNETWPLFRVLTADSWGGGVASGSTWTVEPSFEHFTLSKPYAFGFDVLYASRVCLPAVGEARIRFRYGLIDGRIVAPSDTSYVRGRAGHAWDSGTDTLTVPDLRKKEIRIQAAPRAAAGATPAWRTVWWGQCEYMEDRDAAGAPIPMGERIYHCVDGLYRTSRWPLNKHGFYLAEPDGSNTRPGERAAGHPGYNSVDGLGATRGNKDPSGLTFDPTKDATGKGGDGRHNVLCHTWEGAGNLWSDREAIEHALNVARPTNEPVFLLSGTTGLYTTGEGGAYEVMDEDSAWDFTTRACRRQRGRGVAFVDWENDSALPTGPLTVSLRVYPQLLDNTTASINGSAVVTIPGATSAGTTVAVDLIGDHRNVPGMFSLGDRDQHRVDMVESIGENIQVLVTLSRYDGVSSKISLDNRWKASEEGVFAALASTRRCDERWRPVFQLYGLPRTWGALAGDHNRGTKVPYHRVDYRCLENGAISFPGGPGAAPPNNVWDTNPNLVEVLPDLPLFEGYTYTGSTPVRKDGAAETGTPQRRPPLILIRSGENKYIIGEEALPPMTISVGHDGIFMYAPSDIDGRTGAYRVVGNTTTSIGSGYNNEQIGCTVGLRLPHRVRTVTYGTDADGKLLTELTARRKLRIRHDGLHLWLASPGAIWDVDGNNTSAPRVVGQGAVPLRNAGGATTDAPGLLRDDRAILGKRHALACSWFLNERRTASWGIKACGLLPSYTYADGNGGEGGTTNYPTLGYTVTTLSAGGQDNVINTPITSIVYDNEQGVTSWSTDWAELDFQ